jgi:preprotein translocase subunit SecE
MSTLDLTDTERAELVALLRTEVEKTCWPQRAAR